MANIKTIQRSFSGGELTPEFFSKSDDAKYLSGLAECENFICMPHGAVQNRAGFKFVRQTKMNNKKSRLIPFKYSIDQTMVIELGEGYTRFHTQGLTLLHGNASAWSSAIAYAKRDMVSSGGFIYYCLVANINHAVSNADFWYKMPSDAYEIPNAYLEQDLFSINFVQSNDIITFVHNNYPPTELKRYGVTSWSFDQIDFTPQLSPPTSVTASPFNVTSGLSNHSYVVTAVNGAIESQASLEATCQNNILVSGSNNTISWSPSVSGSVYNVYKKQAGVFGLIGTTSDNSLIDDNVAVNTALNPPRYEFPFTVGGIVSAQVISGGSSYNTAFLSGGSFISVSIVNPGSLYNSVADTLSSTDPNGTPGVFSFTVNGGGEFTQVNVLSGGSGNVSPTLIVNTATGTGVRLSAKLTPVIYKQVTLSISDPTGYGAELIAVVSNGVIVGTYVKNPGQFYTNPVVSTNEAAGGSGAVFGACVLSGSEYPSAVGYYEQRRFFAGTNSSPQTIWATKTGTESVISASASVKDDDRILFRVSSRDSSKIRHILPLGSLLLLTDASEFKVSSINSDAMTPTSFSVRPHSFFGSSEVQPILTGNTGLFFSQKNQKIHQISYNQQGGLSVDDICIRSPHLFLGHSFVSMDVSFSPTKIIWAVRDDGVLIGLTYLPEQEIIAFHRHVTDGMFESVAVVNEGGNDVVYAVVKRNVSGIDCRYVEKMMPRNFENRDDAFFVDSGLSYSGAEATVISGLSHLEGKTVKVLADGEAHRDLVVSLGQVTLDRASSNVKIGLGYVSTLKTLPFVAQIDNAFGSGRTKNINKAWVRVHKSNGVSVGTSPGNQFEFKERTDEGFGALTAQQSDELEVYLPGDWTSSGQIFVIQRYPLSAIIESITLEASIGGA